MADWANKVKGWGLEEPTQLLANPHNYRRHPAAQREALRGSLDELGVVVPVIVNTVTGHLVDGHARVEEYITAGIEKVPVVYVELTEAEEKIALLSLDPISALAVDDRDAIRSLLEKVEVASKGLQDVFDTLARRSLPQGDAFAKYFEEVAAATHKDVTCPHCAEHFAVPVEGDVDLEPQPEAA